MIYVAAFLVGFIAAGIVELVKSYRAYRAAKAREAAWDEYAAQNDLPEDLAA
jgi:hypothetical protein